ncbi:unconventional myosin-IXAa-like isoform X2 [Planococcus citri]|uniref:unconventional myosin-IXAa-like isoform X2 n=1 Tax=Planococcus citri TaxID=170843 RepID=UPI0031F8AA19
MVDTAVSSNRFIVQVFVGALSPCYEALSVEASKQTTSEEIISCIIERLGLSGPGGYELAEVVGDGMGRECKERRLGPHESPVAVMLLWPQITDSQQEVYRFYLREKLSDSLWADGFTMDPQLIRDYFYRFLYQPQDREYPDLCQLPDLNEQTLLDNLRARFNAGHIYTYVGSILIAVNPFKFHPIYNPKYVKLYQNRRLGPELPPHIFAIADSAYHCMLRERRNQCIVISGESGSGKTESTNFLLHHLTALSQKGSHGSGVEQTILSAGPVLEAFGNAKTAHNNNSSRFGKFIQVNYKENGMVHGAVVQKYLLEKSRICSQGNNERNYHVFYYLLAGTNETERELLHLQSVEKYNYLNRTGCYVLDNVDEKYEFSRLKQSMEMVGFTQEKQRRLFAVLSAVLLLGNVEFQPRKLAYHHDEAVSVKNPEVVQLISELLRVKQETLMAALTAKRARASGETLVINYKFPEAIAARDAIAKCLYGALFDWIVLQVNHALLSKKDTFKVHQGNSIGVLDIFGFEDFGLSNSFEQFCINYANEHLQYYFNQHVFKYEQEEYRKEGIRWSDIEFLDNTGCLQLIEGKPNGLLCVLDDHCNFPGATSETLLQKFNSVHKENPFYEIPQKKENAFIVRHYAGKVKYQVGEMREKNLDLMRQDIVSVLKNSSMAFVRELVGADPVAVFRWAILRAFFRAYFAFNEAGMKHRQSRDGSKAGTIQNRYRNHSPNDNLIKFSTQRYSVGGGLETLANDRLLCRTRSDNQNRDRDRDRILATNTTITTLNCDTDAVDGVEKVTSKQGSRSSGGSAGAAKLNNTNKHTALRRTSHCVEDAASKTSSSSETTVNHRRKLYVDEADVFKRATQIVMKNKSFRPRDKGKKGLKNLQSVKTLAGRTQSYSNTLSGKARKQPLTVSAQFQLSLHSLMETLNQANPFFIRCIKSNGEKIPNLFDEDTVQRQLRYTGMLETVRIRQAGYNVRLSYEEFIHLYRILLPKGLLSSQSDVRDFLLTLNLNRDNYQLGSTKIFMRECEKLKLDYRLHQQIMASIVVLQRWFRVLIERRRFLRLRDAVTTLQSWWRMVSAQKLANKMRNCNAAAACIQSMWRTHKTSTWYRKLRTGVVNFQAHARGYLTRRKIREQQEQMGKVAKSKGSITAKDSVLSKESSQEDFELPTDTESPPESESGSFERDFAEEMALLHIGDPNKTILNRELKKKLSYTCMKNKTEKYYCEEFSVDKYDRKGSSDSLSSQKNGDSHSVVPVKETLHKAKKHLQSIMGVSKKSETTSNAHSDSEVDDFSITAWNKQSEFPGPRKPLPARSAHLSSEPTAPARYARRRDLHSKSVTDDTKKNENNERFSQANSYNSIIDASAASSRNNNTHSKQMVDLKRRNSDPATQVGDVREDLRSRTETVPVTQRKSPVTHSPSFELLTWKGTTMFTIAGHRFRKISRFSKEDRCMYCSKPMDAFVTQGHKCSDCKRLFHTKCIQNGGVLQLPCIQQHVSGDGSGRRKRRKHNRTSYDKSQVPSTSSAAAPVTSGVPITSRDHHSKFSLTGTSEFTDSTDKIISDAKELQLMQDFINKKIYKMESEEGTKPSQVDRIFKQALREFKDNLVATYSVVNKQGVEVLNIKYKDLIANFLHVIETVCLHEETCKDFPVTLCVNAFRGFMNEFMTMTRLEAEKPSKAKRKKKKKHKGDEYLSHVGHLFQLNIINIPTACEVCSSFFLWPIEKGLVCRNCKLTCHKKCYPKVTVECGKEVSTTDGSSNALTSATGAASNNVFGVPLHLLATSNGKVPLVVERLITTIEMYGLYTEGIYRKSGLTSKVRELKNLIEQSNIDNVRFEEYQVHVLSSVLKTFLREMPEPLLTFECYDDFIRAASLTEDRVSTLFTILKKLPKPNYDLMERLIFHLARVAVHEDVNRMNAASLAIIFAPCILKTNKIVPAQNSLNDIEHQTLCIKLIINEQVDKLKATLADIDTLDNACHTATDRLSSIRTSKVYSPTEDPPEKIYEEEQRLVGQIQEIKKEKEILTTNLPSLRRTNSDDDLLSTDDGSLDDMDTNSQPSSNVGMIVPHKRKHQSSSSCKRVANVNLPDSDEDPIMV